MPLPAIAILTAVHRRHDLARRMLRHTAAVARSVADVCSLRTAAVVSVEDYRPLAGLCDELGVLVVESVNRPVSCKWQRGLDMVADALAPDAVMLMGSDDFVNAAYVRGAVAAMSDGQWDAGFGPSDLWFFQKGTGRLGHWVGPMHLNRDVPGGWDMPCGAGRVYPRKLLDAVDWCLWDFKANAGLDSYSSINLYGRGHVLACRPLAAGEMIVDVKTGENIHSWRSIPYDVVLDGEAAREKLAQHGLEVIYA